MPLTFGSPEPQACGNESRAAVKDRFNSNR